MVICSSDMRHTIVRAAALFLFVLACCQCAAGGPGLINQLQTGHPQKIVVYGTSLTASGAWVSQLSSGLSSQYPGLVTFVNAGLSGKASNSGVANLQSSVLAAAPDAVFIEFGMNDAFTDYPSGDIDKDITPAQSKANLNAMIDAILAARPNCEIVLQTMNPAWNAPNGNQSGSKRPELATYYVGYRQVAADRGLRIVDNYATWLKLQSNQQSVFESYVSDGTHPNATGYQRFATPAIQSVFGANNGLALLIDPTNGKSVLQNQTFGQLGLISYTISSSSGALLTSWKSLADQRQVDWFEANPTTHNLSELNRTGALQLPSRSALDLGQAWNSSAALDISMTYQTPDGVNHVGLVAFTPTASAINALAGDYDHNGAVDAADYVVWRKTVGNSVANGSNADGSGNGLIDAFDFISWREKFGSPAGASAALASVEVPEPVLGLLLIPLCVAAISRRVRLVEATVQKRCWQ